MKIGMQEFVTMVAEREGISKVAAREQINSVFDVITEIMCNRNEVAIPEFGTFGYTHREARKGRNPQTGEELAIPESDAPRFKAAAALKRDFKA